jgi:hypothetical protein
LDITQSPFGKAADVNWLRKVSVFDPPPDGAVGDAEEFCNFLDIDESWCRKL